MSTEFPYLQGADHKVFGQEYCSGYSDSFGHWSNGFYCPQTDESQSSAISCCGTSTYKYCCIAQIIITTQPSSSILSPMESGGEVVLIPFLQIPLLSGMVCGIIFTVVFITIGLCYRYSWGIFHIIERTSAAAVPAEVQTLYRIQCNSAISNGSSSNIYSPPSASSSATSNTSNRTLLSLDVETLVAYRDYLCSSQLVTEDTRPQRTTYQNNQYLPTYSTADSASNNNNYQQGTNNLIPSVSGNSIDISRIQKQHSINNNVKNTLESSLQTKDIRSIIPKSNRSIAGGSGSICMHNIYYHNISELSDTIQVPRNYHFQNENRSLEQRSTTRRASNNKLGFQHNQNLTTQRRDSYSTATFPFSQKSYSLYKIIHLQKRNCENKPKVLHL